MVKRFAQSDRLMESPQRLIGMTLGVSAKMVGLVRREESGLPGKGGQIGIAREVLPAMLRIFATANGVGEVKTKDSAGEIEFVLRWALGWHYAYCNWPCPVRG